MKVKKLSHVDKREKEGVRELRGCMYVEQPYLLRVREPHADSCDVLDRLIHLP